VFCLWILVDPARTAAHRHGEDVVADELAAVVIDHTLGDLPGVFAIRIGRIPSEEDSRARTGAIWWKID
jgi:hypothetical protein